MNNLILREIPKFVSGLKKKTQIKSGGGGGGRGKIGFVSPFEIDLKNWPVLMNQVIVGGAEAKPMAESRLVRYAGSENG